MLKKTLLNCRVLASLLYDIVRVIDPSLPIISPQPIVPATQPAAGPVTAVAALAAATAQPKNGTGTPPTSSATPSSSTTSSNSDTSSSTSSSSSTPSTSTFGLLFRNKMYHVGATDYESVNEILLQPRKPYNTLQDIHNFLLPQGEPDRNVFMVYIYIYSVYEYIYFV